MLSYKLISFVLEKSTELPSIHMKSYVGVQYGLNQIYLMVMLNDHGALWNFWIIILNLVSLKRYINMVLHQCFHCEFLTNLPCYHVTGMYIAITVIEVNI